MHLAVVCHPFQSRSKKAPREERDANARLMAAAPRLLAACESAIKLLRGSGFTENTPTLFELTGAVAEAKGDEK